MEKWKTNKRDGISLIVLVITIIVMIILATVIILSLDSSNIIERANEAKESTNLANLKEAASVALAEYQLEVSLGNIDGSEISANDYVKDKLEEQGIDTSTMTVTEDEKILTGLTEVAVAFIEAGVPVGASITGYTLSAATSAKTVSTDGSENTCDADNYVETDPQPATGIARDENITWSYMGVDENGEALIVGSVTSTTPKVTLGGKGGYLNGPSTLNTICDTMYSSDMGTARSMNVEDVNMILGTNPVGKYYNTSGSYVENAKGLTIGELVAAGETALSMTSTPDGKDINTYVPNYYTIAKSSVTASDAIKNMVYPGSTTTNPTLTTTYWLSSPCVHAYFINGYANFYVRCVNSSNVNAYYVFYSGDDSYYITYAVRPVVSLASDVQVTYNGTTAAIS